MSNRDTDAYTVVYSRFPHNSRFGGVVDHIRAESPTAAAMQVVTRLHGEIAIHAVFEGHIDEERYNWMDLVSK